MVSRLFWSPGELLTSLLTIWCWNSGSLGPGSVAHLQPHPAGCCKAQGLGSWVTPRSGKQTAPETLNNKNSQAVIFFSSAFGLLLMLLI